MKKSLSLLFAAALMAAARAYAQQLGLAFQIRDDMLDVIGDTEQFGKPIGSDREEGKVTFVDLLGLEGCSETVLSCTAKAKAAPFGAHTGPSASPAGYPLPLPGRPRTPPDGPPGTPPCQNSGGTVP